MHNSVDLAKARSPLKRQASSPYLRSSSSNKNLKGGMKKSFTSQPQEKLMKNIEGIFKNYGVPLPSSLVGDIRAVELHKNKILGVQK